MPLQLVDRSLEVLLYELSALVLVVVQHHALQDLLGELQVAYLLLSVLTYVEQELVVAVSHQLTLQAVGDALTEVSLVLHTLAEYALEELSVNSCRLEVADLGHLEAEVSIHILDSLLVGLQQSCNLSVVVGIGLLRIEDNDVAGLATLELLLLVLVLDVAGHNHATLGGDTTLECVALSVQLAQVALQGVVAAPFLSLNKLTSL